jgi:hypothetical protein
MEMSNTPDPHGKEARPENTADDVDLSLLEDSLAMTPWERMQANDDAVNFADALHTAVRERNAKSGSAELNKEAIIQKWHEYFD